MPASAHAIERLYLHCRDRSGRVWLKVAQPALRFAASTVVELNSAAMLDQFLAEHGATPLDDDVGISTPAEPRVRVTYLPPKNLSIDVGVESKMLEVDEIRAAIDGFTAPGQLRGWAFRRRDGMLLGGLRIEGIRDNAVIASAVPSIPRLDVTGDPESPAGFSLTFPVEVSVEDILSGIISLHAIDENGRGILVPIWEVTREIMRSEMLLEAARGADPVLALKILELLSANTSLTEDIRQELTINQKRISVSNDRATGCYRPRSGPKITLIGAGSTVFAKNLIGDILLHPALAASSICLYDINPERLRMSQIVAERIRQTLGSAATIEITQDLGAALDGARYAISMMQVGGYQPCTVTDFEIPKRFGLRQTIADTLGIGGIMRGLRTIPVLLDIAREMEKRCPDVLHLNYANPMAMNCWAMSRASSIRTIGLCHSVPHTAAEMARDIGMRPEAVEYLVAGINHMAFYLKFESGGEDLYPRLHQVVADRRVAGDNRIRYDMLQRLGYFVTESSEHFAEYVPWYIKRGQEELIDRFNIPLDEYPRRCELQLAEWEQLSKTLLDPDSRPQIEPSPEYGSTIINAIETGRPAVIYGNVANSGLITNLPEGCCVELPCLVDQNGVQPVHIGSLPPQLAALIQTNVNVQALTVEAALTGKRQHVYHAAMLDPHTAAELNLDQIWKLTDAMLEAHRDWLPKAFF